MLNTSNIKTILSEGSFPSDRELARLDFDTSGYSWYLQKCSRVPSGVTANIVKCAHNSQGRPCFKLAGCVEVKQPTVTDKGVAVLIMSGKHWETTVPTMWDAYCLVRSNWELNS